MSAALRWRAALLPLALLGASVTSAQAQKASGVDQISQAVNRASLASAPQQIRPPASRDTTTVNQLASSLSEHAIAPGGHGAPGAVEGAPIDTSHADTERAAAVHAAAVHADPTHADAPNPEAALEALAVSRHRTGSVDADEIARLLNEGAATSIDAAAAIASGVAGKPTSTPVEEPKRLPAPLGSLFSDLPGG